MERCEQLWPNGPRYLWDEHCFPPSTDSFLLAAYPPLKRGAKVCDLGAGAGLLGVLLLSREPSLSVVGIEKEAHACAMMQRNAAENHLNLTAVQGDLRDRDSLPQRQSFDLVITNPPYFAANSGAVAVGGRGIERTESTAALTDLLDAADYLLRYGGDLAIVYKTERLAELLYEATARKLIPKRLRLVHAHAKAAPSMALLLCKKGGHHGLIVEPPLLMKEADGRESDYVKAAYFREKEGTL